MKLEVAKSDLENALQVVSIGSQSSGGDLTAHFVFRHQDDLTSLFSYNGRLGTSVPLVCKTIVSGESETAFTVEAWRLKQWLKAVDDVALTLDVKDAVITATAPSGSVKFRSLDPSSFPFWDKILRGATKTMTIEASRFHAALSHAKSFISSADTTRPEMAVTEVRDGALWATDAAGLTFVTLDEFEKSNLRIHGKDIPSVLTFLLLSGDDKVEILEHDRSLFLRRDDGGILSVGRPTQPFIALEDIQDSENHWWVVGTNDLERAIGQLSASAAKEDKRFTLNFDPVSQKVLVSMTADSGSTNVLKMDCPEYGSEDGVEVGLPEDGWTISWEYLTRLLSTYKGGKTIRLGLNPTEEGLGWSRVMEDRDGDKFLTILLWMP